MLQWIQNHPSTSAAACELIFIGLLAVALVGSARNKPWAKKLYTYLLLGGR